MPASAQAFSLALDATQRVGALLLVPADARALFVFAHGAGAGMKQAFMAAVAEELAQRGVATLRYQFPYMERGSRRPDPPAVAQAAVRAAVAEGARQYPRLPLFAGGKSFGARMTSQAQAASPMPVRGLVFIGFPLHPPRQPGDARGAHLSDVRVPMLFLQGTKDAFARLDLLQGTVQRLGAPATLRLFAHADHSFHVPARSGLQDAQLRAQLCDALAAWIDQRIAEQTS